MLKVYCLICLIVVFAESAGFVQAQDSAAPQTVFNLDEPIQNVVSLPDQVLAVLKSDPIVDVCFKEKGGNPNEVEWFAASEIDLNGDQRQDLIIKANDSCLYVANQGSFWIFQNRTDGFQKILSANGLQLAILPKKSNSFNRIKISKVIPNKPFSQIYEFRNGKYVPAKTAFKTDKKIIKPKIRKHFLQSADNYIKKITN